MNLSCYCWLINTCSLCQAARKLERRENDARAGNQPLRRELADISNQKGMRPPKKRRGMEQDPSQSDDKDDDKDSSPSTKIKTVERYARKHAIMMLLWHHDDRKIFATALDDDYNPLERFENEENKKQGQLRDILASLPEEYRDITKSWIKTAVRINIAYNV